MALGLVLAATFALPFLPYVEFGVPFDKHVWVGQGFVQNDRLHVRGRMAYGLISSHRLIGLTRAEVLALLDPPPETGKYADWDIVYWLGPDRTLSTVDSEWLVLRLNAQGKVSEARLIDD